MIQIKIDGRIPSKKNNKRIIRAGGRFMLISSRAWVEFEKITVPLIKEMLQAQDVIQPPYMISIKMYSKGRLRTDLDNTITGILDLLQKSGAIKDDGLVNSIMAFRSMGHKYFFTEVNVSTSNFKDFPDE